VEGRKKRRKGGKRIRKEGREKSLLKRKKEWERVKRKI
jgi:hypothetical protein